MGEAVRQKDNLRTEMRDYGRERGRERERRGRGEGGEREGVMHSPIATYQLCYIHILI